MGKEVQGAVGVGKPGQGLLPGSRQQLPPGHEWLVLLLHPGYHCLISNASKYLKARWDLWARVQPVSSSGLRGQRRSSPTSGDSGLDKNWEAVVVSLLTEVQCPPYHSPHARKFRKDLSWSPGYGVAALPGHEQQE